MEAILDFDSEFSQGALINRIAPKSAPFEPLSLVMYFCYITSIQSIWVDSLMVFVLTPPPLRCINDL